jgi:Zn-dependent protease/predicted transcriptional regulator
MSTLPVARLFGFEIRVHVSWAIILAIIAVSVSSQVGSIAPGTEPVARWAIGGVVAIAFLLSALAHELGHAIVARRVGLPGGSVTLYFFGGTAAPANDARRPRDEIAVALAGPAVSLVIGAVLVLGAVVLALLMPRVTQGPIAIIGQITFIVGALNLVLGLVNLVPAYPLDAARAAHGVAWARTGDAVASLLVVARLGRWLGIAAAVVGVVLILTLDSVDGLMLSLAGWFLLSTGRAVERVADVERLLEGLTVADIMESDVGSIPAGLTLDTFADRLLGTVQREGATVGTVTVTRDARMIGVLGRRQVRAVRRDRWATTRAEDVMAAADTLPLIEPSTTVRVALRSLHGSGQDGLPVTDAGRLAGIVTRRSIADAIRARRLEHGATS